MRDAWFFFLLLLSAFVFRKGKKCLSGFRTKTRTQSRQLLATVLETSPCKWLQSETKCDKCAVNRDSAAPHHSRHRSQARPSLSQCIMWRVLCDILHHLSFAWWLLIYFFLPDCTLCLCRRSDLASTCITAHWAQKPTADSVIILEIVCHLFWIASDGRQ